MAEYFKIKKSFGIDSIKRLCCLDNSLIYYLDPEDLVEYIKDPLLPNEEKEEYMACMPCTVEGKKGIYLEVRYPYTDQDGNITYYPVDFQPRNVIFLD